MNFHLVGMKLFRKPVNRIFCLGDLMCSAVWTPNFFSQTPASTNSASITGRVTLSGKGVPNVTIIATSATAFDGRAIGQAKTDQYALVSAEGPFEMRGKTINLSNGESVERVDFHLARGGVITGRVTDSDGAAVIGEQVAVNKTDAQNGMWLYETERYRTDDRGIYRIFGLEVRPLSQCCAYLAGKTSDGMAKL